MLATRRSVRHSARRALLARRHRKVYVGGAVTRRASSRVFLARSTQHVTVRTLLVDWVGALFTLVGIASWGLLLMLLGA
jgi:hypothetical protein